jgi:hypothetical protein
MKIKITIITALCGLSTWAFAQTGGTNENNVTGNTNSLSHYDVGGTNGSNTNSWTNPNTNNLPGTITNNWPDTNSDSSSPNATGTNSVHHWWQFWRH